MEKIIFFGLVIPIMAYVLYLGGMAIMNGFKSKEANRAEKEQSENETGEISETDSKQTSTLSDELSKLNDLKVLKGFSLEKFKPELICVEIHEKEIKDSEIYEYLSNFSYELVWSGVFSHIFKSKS